MTYEYKTVNISLEPDIVAYGHTSAHTRSPTIETAANRWMEMGWETVGVMQISSEDKTYGFADSILVRRPVKATKYEYMTVELDMEKTETKDHMYKVSEVANRYASAGWRVIGIVPPREIVVVTAVKIHDGGLILERVKPREEDEDE